MKKINNWAVGGGRLQVVGCGPCEQGWKDEGSEGYRQDEEGKDLGGAIEAGYDDEDMEEEQHVGTHEIEL